MNIISSDYEMLWHSVWPQYECNLAPAGGVCASQGTFSSFWRSIVNFLVYKLKGGLQYNTDCFSYWQGTIQASYAVMRWLLLNWEWFPYMVVKMAK